MPAIQMSRLKHQIAQLGDSFRQPDVFQHTLHEVLYFYANRTLRPQQSGARATLIPHYSPPAQVLRQIQVELTQRCAANPTAALALADRLWADTYLEPRILAIFLLGEISPNPPEPILQRLREWAVPSTDHHLLDLLLASGKTRLQKEKPALWVDLLSSWLASDKIAIQALGLRALRSMVDDQSFENLPLTFVALTPLVSTSSSALIPELKGLIAALAQRSPGETVYFLRHALSVSNDDGAARLVRRCLDAFDPATQDGLRSALRVKAEQG